MKKQTLLISICIIGLNSVMQLAHAQSPITLNYQNFLMPLSDTFIFLDVYGNVPPAPSLGANQIWDYGHQDTTISAPFIETRLPADSHFPTARTRGFVSTGLLGYGITDLADSEALIWSDDHDGLTLFGWEYFGGRVSLEDITSVTADSLILPAQFPPVAHSGFYQPFPITYGKHWSLDLQWTENLLISLASEGLDHAPLSIAWHWVENDSVVAWGKMRVPTSNGPSKYIRGLMENQTDIVTGKVYVNGEPASKEVTYLITGDSDQYQLILYQQKFMRKGYWDEIFDMDFTDSTFSVVPDVAFNTNFVDIYCGNGAVKMCDDNGHTQCVPYAHNVANDAMLNHGWTIGACDEEKISAEEESSEDNISATAFPNPTSSSFTLNITLPELDEATITVIDLSGRMIEQFTASEGSIEMGANYPPGIYFIQVEQDGEKELVKVVKTK